MLRLISILPLLALAIPAHAEDVTPKIVVSGNGTVQTSPDIASIAYTVHGEGETADQAVSALVAKRKAIDAGLARMAGATPPLGGQMVLREVRARECDATAYGQPRLSTGACSVIGVVADLPLTMRTGAVRDAATMVGLIGRLGGQNPRVESFSLSNDEPARRRAVAAALAEAKSKAQAIADGSGVRLGTLLSVTDGDYGREREIVVTGSAFAPPPPPPPPPPIAVDATPRPIETQARVTVTYAIGGAN